MVGVKNDFLEDMGKRIAECRKEHNMTQEKLAEKTEVSLQTISNIELGKKAVRPENLAKICSVLDVTSDYIIFGRRSAKQLDSLIKQISSLSPDDYKIVKELVERIVKQ